MVETMADTTAGMTVDEMVEMTVAQMAGKLAAKRADSTGFLTVSTPVVLKVEVMDAR